MLFFFVLYERFRYPKYFLYFCIMQTRLLHRNLLPCFLCALVFLCQACRESNSVHLKGEVQNLTDSVIYIYGIQSDSTSLLAVRLTNGIFDTHVMPDSIFPLTLILNDTLELPIFAAIGDVVRITGDACKPSSLRVEGGDEINEALNKWRAKSDSLDIAVFITVYPDHLASVWLCLNKAQYEPDFDREKMHELTDKLTPQLREHPLFEPLHRELSYGNAPPPSLSIPYYSQQIHTRLRTASGAIIDTTLTGRELSDTINALIK